MQNKIIYYKVGKKFKPVHSDTLIEEGHLTRRNVALLRITDTFAPIAHLRARKLKAWLTSKGATEYHISEAVD
jgi:hypothetical protein